MMWWTQANHLTGRPRDAPLRRVTTLTEHLCTGNKGTASKRLWLPVFRDVLHKQHAALIAISREDTEYKGRGVRPQVRGVCPAVPKAIGAVSSNSTPLEKKMEVIQ
jgi:hypothetical protein